MKTFVSYRRLSLCLAVAAVLAVGCSGPRQASLPPEASDPSTIALLGDEVISASEFAARFERSIHDAQSDTTDSLALHDFLDRYVDFRLKVKAAEDAGLAELPEVKEEINSYRLQLARPYMLEQNVIEPLIRELHERSKITIDASHILLRVDPDDRPADTLEVYNFMASLLDSLKAGADFGDLAARYSEDPPAGNPNAPMGYRGRYQFSSGQMVAPFEEAAYNTPVGEVSDIFRTDFGYHIVKVHDRQPSMPDIEVAHIMMRLASPATATAEDSAEVIAQLRDLKAQIEAGADFGDLAREYSVDPNTRSRGGLLGVIDRNNPRIPPSFREAAFALEHPGDVSDVVVTPVGFHLIQLKSRTEPPSFEEVYDEMKSRIMRTPRGQAAVQAYARKARARLGTTVDTALVRAVFANVPADTLLNHLAADDLDGIVPDTTFATIGTASYSLRDFFGFLPSQLRSEDEVEEQAIGTLDAYLNERALDYEAARLEQRDEEFSLLMEEFRDGLLLFRLMEDSVWNAATRDSIALEAYYDDHRDAYRFPDRTRIIGFYGASDSLLTDLADRLDAGTPVGTLIAEITADSLASIRVDTTRIAGETNSVYDHALALAEGEHTEVLPYHDDQALLVNDGVEPARPKTFEEARSEVISDYQEVLEAALVERLRKRYNLRVYPERLGQVRAALATSAGDEPLSAQ